MWWELRANGQLPGAGSFRRPARPSCATSNDSFMSTARWPLRAGQAGSRSESGTCRAGQLGPQPAVIIASAAGSSTITTPYGPSSQRYPAAAGNGAGAPFTRLPHRSKARTSQPGRWLRSRASRACIFVQTGNGLLGLPFDHDLDWRCLCDLGHFHAFSRGAHKGQRPQWGR
jgi:hypothetical protein